jgi:diguanylate cyclase (GGDEF)-like protein
VDPQPPAGVDHWDLRLRAGTVRSGAWITVGVCGAGVLYCGITWSAAHRLLIIGLLAASMLGALVLLMLDAEAIVRSRWREPFFVGWSVIDIALIGVMEVLDGGARSPIGALFFLPMVFAALSYPTKYVWSIATANVGAALAAGMLVPDTQWSYLVLFASALAAVGCMCVWQARHQDEQREDLARLSRTDSLTGVLNRRGFEERLDAELRESARGDRPLTLMLLDLDDFKGVNDSLGHAAGDELLRWVAQTVMSALRQYDSVGRLGGDEFAVLLPDSARADALEPAARIRDVLSERITATIGLATFPFDGASREQLHHHADAELYAGKRTPITR